MGEVLRWTPLRHQMLRQVADGDVSRGLAASGWRLTGRLPASPARCSNAVDGLVKARWCRIVGDWKEPIALTDAGRALLAEWDTKHPEVAGTSPKINPGDDRYGKVEN